MGPGNWGRQVLLKFTGERALEGMRDLAFKHVQEGRVAIVIGSKRFANGLRKIAMAHVETLEPGVWCVAHDEVPYDQAPKLVFVVTPEVFGDEQIEVSVREYLFEFFNDGASVYIAVTNAEQWHQYPPEVRAIELTHTHDPELGGLDRCRHGLRVQCRRSGECGCSYSAAIIAYPESSNIWRSCASL